MDTQYTASVLARLVVLTTFITAVCFLDMTTPMKAAIIAGVWLLMPKRLS